MSGVDGVVYSAKALRGTLLVKVGDAVKKGDALIGAYTVSGEEKYPSAVIGVVTILTTETYFFETEIFSNDFLLASVKKAEFLTNGEIIDYTYEEKHDGYLIKLTVKKAYSGG